MLRKLLDIRLTYIYSTFFIFYALVLRYVDRLTLTPGQLALFSVNSILFGYYFGPLLAAQKTRVDTMNKTVRTETMLMLDILAQAHLLTEKQRLDIKRLLASYVDSILDNPNVRAENRHYDELLYYVTKGKHRSDIVMQGIYNRLQQTQGNRDTLNGLYTSAVFNHEWMVLFMLFFVTLSFILQIDYNGLLLFQMLAAVLCTGLTLLMLILIKYSTLTHKQAKRMWEPLRHLRAEHFEELEKNPRPRVASARKPAKAA